jgi:hypothetical protein
MVSFLCTSHGHIITWIQDLVSFLCTSLRHTLTWIQDLVSFLCTSLRHNISWRQDIESFLCTSLWHNISWRQDIKFFLRTSFVHTLPIGKNKGCTVLVTCNYLFREMWRLAVDSTRVRCTLPVTVTIGRGFFSLVTSWIFSIYIISQWNKIPSSNPLKGPTGQIRSVREWH